eukprot:EG_transcript_11583
MSWFSSALLLCLFCISHSSDVVVLNSGNFENVVSSEENILVEFYAPWCGHCQALEPEYEKAAATLKEQGIKIAKVDATQEEKLAEKYGVSGYPTIKLFKKGEAVKDYRGPRTSSGIVKYMSNVQEGKEEEETDDEGGDGDGEYGAGEGEGEGDSGAGASSTEDPVGLVNLDAFTFDKLVGTNKFDIFVKVDSSYAYGDKENQWAKLSRRVANLTSSKARAFLLGVVGVEDYGDKLNDDLRQRLNVQTEDFPVFKLFKRDSKDPINYVDVVEVDAMSQFLSHELGLWIGRAGCLEEFDRLAYGFAVAADADQQDRISKALILLEGTSEVEAKQSGAYYVRVMKKAAEQGATYAQKEAVRIEKLLESKMTEEKKAEMKLRLNILASFGAKLTAKEEKTTEEKSSEAEDDDA